MNVLRLLTTVSELGLAVVLGGLIGFERQWHQKMAGLRTNALVALGASGFVILGSMIGRGDPTPIAAQVVTGIGFLGAGIILREGINVMGLNTAATLWCSAMVGTFAGAGQAWPSIAAAAFVIATNLLLRPLVRRFNRQVFTAANVEAHYTVEVVCRSSEEAHTRSLLFARAVSGRTRLAPHRQRRYSRYVKGLGHSKGRDGSAQPIRLWSRLSGG